MVNQTLSNAPSDFSAANDPTDLIHGNPHAVQATAADIAHQGAALAETASTLAATSAALPWEGDTAEAFRRHHRAVVTTLDEWHAAHELVHSALQDHQTALTDAQAGAGTALSLWQAARQRAAGPFPWDGDGAALASNAEVVRARAAADIHSAAAQAHTLLEEARTHLRHAGDSAEITVRQALKLLQDSPLPPAPTTSYPTVVVQEPHNGVHDSLSRIAQRTLGEARRWPEIYHLNAGRPVGDHAVLHDPNLLQPGWTLRLPSSPVSPPPVSVHHDPPPAHVGGHPSTPDSDHSSPAHPAHPPLSNHHGGGIDLGDGLVLGGGVVAVLAGIATAVGLPRRLPASRISLPGASPDADLSRMESHETALAPTAIPAAISIGTRDDHTLLIDAAATLGLGLIGPGTDSTARAILLSTLASQPDAAAVLTTDDLTVLLPAAADRSSHTVKVVESLDAALDHLEREILTRTRRLEETGGSDRAAPLLLITTGPPDTRRLQPIADLGAGMNIIVIVLGNWPPGVTCHIDAGGVVTSAYGSSWATSLIGLRAFTAGAGATNELLALLNQRTPPPPATTAPATVPAVLEQADQAAASPAPVPEPTDIAARLSPTSAEAAAAPPEPPSPPSPARPIYLTVLGQLHVDYRPHPDSPTKITERLAPKQREILTYLALHPEGVRRETLVTALWPNAPTDRPFNSFHATLSQMRRAIRAATDQTVDTLTLQRDGCYQLDPDVVDVDLWHLNNALRASKHAATDSDRDTALREATDLYAGHLAEDVSGEWIDAPREALRRDALNALAILIRLVRATDDERSLSLLEHARQLDPYNEAIYRDIMRTEAHLGRHEAIVRSLDLLHTALAEIKTTPSPETETLARELQRRHP